MKKQVWQLRYKELGAFPSDHLKFRRQRSGARKYQIIEGSQNLRQGREKQSNIRLFLKEADSKQNLGEHQHLKGQHHKNCNGDQK